MNIVLDTNIFISGIFWAGEANKIISLWKEEKFNLVISLEALTELIRVLKDFKIKLPNRLIKRWTDLIIRNSKLVIIENKLNIIKEHPADNIFLETALVGNADYIITYDNHLLNLREFRGIKIIKPEELIRKL